MQTLLMPGEPTSDRHISFAIALQVLLVSVKNILIQAFPTLLEQNDILNILLFVVVAVLYVHAFLSLGMRMLYVGRLSLGIMTFVLVTWVVSFLTYPQNATELIDLLPRFLPYCFLTGFLITRLTTLKWLSYYMMRFSYVVTLTALFSAIYILTVGHSAISDWSTYSMPISTYTLISTMWHFQQFFSEKRLLPLSFAVVGTLVIILVGSRNPLLAILVYLLVSVLRKLLDRKQTFLTRLLALGSCSAAAILLLFWQQIVSLIYTLLYALGIHSRTLYTLIQEEVSSSGRDVIHSRLIEYMNQRPLTPLGVAGDRMPLEGEYAHSLYLSILATFGYVLGAVVLGLLLFMCIRALKRSRGNAREMLLLYMCIVLPRGFVAVDVWQNDVFWWMLAIMIVILDPIRAETADAGEAPTREKRETLPGGAE